MNRLVLVRGGTVVNIKDNIPEGDPQQRIRVRDDVEFFVERDPGRPIEIGDTFDTWTQRAKNSFAEEPSIWAILRDLGDRLRGEESPPKPPYTDNEWASYVVNILREKQPALVPIPIVPGLVTIKTGAGIASGSGKATAVGTVKASAATRDRQRKLKQRQAE